MVENLDSAVNSLSEQTKKINIALYYTGNDMDKARQMAAGTYKDVYAIKIKFTSSSLYGVVLIFVNFIQFRPLDIFLVVSNDYLIANIDNMGDWKSFEKDISAARANVQDFRLINEIKDKLERGLASNICTSIVKLIDKNDAIQLSHVMQKFFQESAGLQRVDISTEFQKISSLEVELESISTRKIDSKAVIEKKEENPENQEIKPEDTESEDIKPGANGIKAIIRSSLILSPIKGKHISELKISDRVLISMIDLNDQTKTIARAFNAYKEEDSRILPIPARIKSLRYIDGTGYKIYVVIAKGILGQIIEEEKNIKIAMDPAAEIINTSNEKEQAGNTGLIMIAVLVAVILILVSFILITIL